MWLSATSHGIAVNNIGLGIMVLTIIPTEFLLHKHFTKQGMKK